MKRYWLLLALVPVVAGLSCLERGPKARRRMAAWDQFQFRELNIPRSRSCSFLFTSPGLADDGAEVRLLFEVQPQNKDYYFVGIRRDRLTLGKVECGVELPLAEWRPGGPTDEPAFARERRVTVLRRPARISVAVGNRKVLELSDDTFSQGRAAIGARGLSGASRPRVYARRMGEIYVVDDFMRKEDEESAWRAISGNWAVKSLQNPGLSANAFSYAGRPSGAGPAVALLGEEWWDDYTFEVSARQAGGAGVGMVFRYVDDANYYLFRYAKASPTGVVQLVRIHEGREKVLAEKKGTLKPAQWYRLAVAARGPLLSAYVDGNLVFQERDDRLSFGQVGLYVADPGGVAFDDVFVGGERGVIEDFGGGRVSWYAKGGNWSVEKVGGVARLRGTGPENGASFDAAKLLLGEEAWAGYRVETAVAPGSSGRVGLVTRYRDESEYDVFIYDITAKKYLLTVVRDGRRRVVAQAPAGPLSSTRELAACLTGAVIVCEADGKKVFSHFDAGVRSGKVGLSVGKDSVGLFEEVSVTFPQATDPVLAQLDVFARESTMTSWAAAKSEWKRQSTEAWGRTYQVNWHRAAFPGGGQIHVGAFFDSTRGSALRLFTCCDLSPALSPARVGSGYELVVGSLGPGSTAGKVELFRNGQAVAAAEIVAPRGNNRVALMKMADHIVAEVNGRAVLAFRDPSPLNGWTTGYAVENVLVEPEDVDVFCENTISYSFVRAVADWRSAGGEWLVTNRWRCDDRWSFFGGESMTGACAIWNKTKFEGDMTLEFAAGIRHQRGRMSGYRFARDMDAVICGDGRSLLSGYGFIFGGWGNTETAITRNGKVVAKCTARLPANKSMHRQWWYIKIEKRGGHLKYYIDGRLVLEYTDPDPLPGGQAALWTYKNGLIVGKVRIAAEKVGPKERFDAAFPDISPCLYGQ